MINLKKIIKILSVMLIAACIFAGMIFYGTFVSVKRVNIVNQTVISNKIPDECNNLKIALISDIHYNSFMDKERLSAMIEKINQASPDIILFAGDLFDKPDQIPVNDAVREELIQLLKTLEAPYGKFAVLGESDHASRQLEEGMQNNFYYADFELLNNTSVLLHKDSTHSINLIGIDSQIGGKPDINKAMENIDTNNFTIVLTHAPDLAGSLPLNNIDLVVAGHSHGGQIALPMFGPLFRKDGARKYTHGTTTVNNTVIIVGNGLGTTDFDIRLFAPPQCIMIRLTNK